MSFQKRIFLGFVLLLFTACTNYKVTSKYEKSIDFSTLKTFKILEQKEAFPKGIGSVNEQRIDKAILKEMIALHYKTSENPDFLVSWYVKINTVEEANLYVDFYRKWKRVSWLEVNYYQKGTLVIDIIDLKNKQVIWHGSTSEKVTDDMPNLNNKIKKAVKSLIEKYTKDSKYKRPIVINDQLSLEEIELWITKAKDTKWNFFADIS